ncbi:hypothetical protein J4558_22865 [Leptolyngbya sp. 15MV]|nr:hypothetical protein J4558_22865 [Leptolyngbya sp. 15MV]
MIGRPASTHAALTIQGRRMTYPDSKRVDVVEAPFGVPVADPYRWLEKDARRDPEVAAWSRAQNTRVRQQLRAQLFKRQRTGPVQHSAHQQ